MVQWLRMQAALAERRTWIQLSALHGSSQAFLTLDPEDPKPFPPSWTPGTGKTFIHIR